MSMGLHEQYGHRGALRAAHWLSARQHTRADHRPPSRWAARFMRPIVHRRNFSGGGTAPRFRAGAFDTARGRYLAGVGFGPRFQIDHRRGDDRRDAARSWCAAKNRQPQHRHSDSRGRIVLYDHRRLCTVRTTHVIATHARGYAGSEDARHEAGATIRAG